MCSDCKNKIAEILEWKPIRGSYLLGSSECKTVSIIHAIVSWEKQGNRFCTIDSVHCTDKNVIDVVKLWRPFAEIREDAEMFIGAQEDCTREYASILLWTA